MRLIDADKLIERLNNSGIEFNANINRIIIDQPTAYDVDKYKWHDLRKNRNDLPKPMEEVLVYFYDENCEINVYEISFYEPRDEWWKSDHIAWKYIEPFENEVE